MKRKQRLTKRQFEKNQTFFLRLLKCKDNRLVKRVIADARPNQLRALIYLLSDFYLRRLEVNPSVLKKLREGRRKSLLKKYLGNNKKVSLLLKTPSDHRTVLLQLAPVINPLVGTLYSPA